MQINLFIYLSMVKGKMKDDRGRKRENEICILSADWQFILRYIDSCLVVILHLIIYLLGIR